MADYSALDRWLHRLALGSPAIAEMIHDLERALYLKSAPPDEGRHVFVTGLARAGTTILLREIHRTGEFGSLTYADMPFVLAPNLWQLVSRRGRTSGRRAERAHGDGIEVDFRSPEALDEVYWRIFIGNDYILPDGLVPHEPDAETIDGYRDLIRLILRRTGTVRYLSKNNNNLLRLGALARSFPEAEFLIPLRDPLQHARSLLSQHRRFLAPDPFVASYMTWLGHHEFGATHRPFRGARPDDGHPDQIDYWLRVWILAHRALEKIEHAFDHVTFVPYEALGREPGVWQAVARRIGVDPDALQEVRAIPERDPGAHDPALAKEAHAIHGRLSARAERALAMPPAAYRRAGATVPALRQSRTFPPGKGRGAP